MEFFNIKYFPWHFYILFKQTKYRKKSSGLSVNIFHHITIQAVSPSFSHSYLKNNTKTLYIFTVATGNEDFSSVTLCVRVCVSSYGLQRKHYKRNSFFYFFSKKLNFCKIFKEKKNTWIEININNVSKGQSFGLKILFLYKILRT